MKKIINLETYYFFKLKLARRIEVSETNAVKHLMKYAATHSKTKNYYYPFASHPRFKFWFYDRIRRHRSLEQAKVYLKNNNHDANMSIKELKESMSNGDSENIMRRMSSYSSNITGSDSYWYKRRCELESTFEQKKPATIFFTFSYADNHWSDLHKLMPRNYNNLIELDQTIDSNKLKTQKYNDVLNNPHLVDWFFSYRLNKFLEVAFDGVLECEWRWHRYEWQSRSAIHAHGAARLKNDPGLIDLTTKVYAGYLAKKNSVGRVFIDLNELETITKIIDDATVAESIVTTYSDTLLTAMNTRLNPEANEVPNPHPCSLYTEKIDKEI